MDYEGRIASDPALRRLLQETRPWSGTSPTRVLGAPVVTVHRLDPGGRVVASETPGWSDEDRGWVLALAAYEARLCPRGHDTSVSMAKEHTWDWRAPTIGPCHACWAQDVEAKRWEDHDHGPVMLYGAAHLADDCEFCVPPE